jgi:hypothetical protein
MVDSVDQTQAWIATQGLRDSGICADNHGHGPHWRGQSRRHGAVNEPTPAPR